MEILFQKLHTDAVKPSYAHMTDAGADLTAVSKAVQNDLIVYDTGLAISIPIGKVGLLFQRSSVSKKDLILSNAVGVLDPGYIGPILFKFRRTVSGLTEEYEVGDRIGQLLIVDAPKAEFIEVDKLPETIRGLGGYGSTGN